MTIALMLAGGVVGLLFVANLGVHLYYAFSGLSRFENRPPFAVHPAPADAPPPEPVEFQTADGVTLRGGVYFPHHGLPHALVVYCPETEGTCYTAMNYVPALLDAGFAVFSFSFRNHDPSEHVASYRPKHWITRYEIRDVDAAIEFALAQPQFAGLPLCLMGVSRGANAALVAGSRRPAVRGVWAQGAFSTRYLSNNYSIRWADAVAGPWTKYLPKWHVLTTAWFVRKISEIKNGVRYTPVENWLRDWRGRDVQFVAGARDSYVPHELTRPLCAATGRAPETGLWVVPRAKHNMERITARDEYDRRLVAFFSQAAGVEQPELELAPVGAAAG